MDRFIKPIDVATRIWRRHRHWYHGEPSVALEGEDHQFGKLKFDFGDEIIQYRVFIHDREEILGAAEVAVKNFDSLVEQILEQRH